MSTCGVNSKTKYIFTNAAASSRLQPTIHAECSQENANKLNVRQLLASKA